jgi:hypothetical protein
MICPRAVLPLDRPVKGYEQADGTERGNACDPAFCLGLHGMMDIVCVG